MDTGRPDRVISGDAPRDVRRPHVESQLFAALARLIGTGRAPSDITVAQIAKEAGIGRATFYLYFDDREAFNVRLLEHLWEQLAEPLARLWSGVAAGGALIDEAVLHFLRVYRDLAPLATAADDAAASGGAVAAQVQARMAELIDATAAALDAGKQAGVIRPEAPSYETASVVVWMTERACFQVARTADDAQLERLAVALSLMSRRGVGVGD